MTVHERLQEIFDLTFGQKVSPDLTRDDPRWDSIRHIEILTAVIEEFGVQLTADEVAELNSFAAIEAFLEHRALP